MNMRAKFIIESITQYQGSEILAMRVVGKNSYDDSGKDENNTFAKFTPAGNLSITIQNPDLIGKFKPGDAYYVDFAKVENLKAVENA